MVPDDLVVGKWRSELAQRDRATRRVPASIPVVSWGCQDGWGKLGQPDGKLPQLGAFSCSCRVLSQGLLAKHPEQM